MSDTNAERDIESSLKPLLIVGCSVFAVWLGCWILMILFGSGWEQRGQFGDMFGAVNSLFAGLAFAGVIYTIYLQRNELALQRKELELTRNELMRSAEAQEHSQRALKEQVDATLLTAQLNALVALIENYELTIESAQSSADETLAKQRRLDYMGRLENVLAQLD